MYGKEVKSPRMTYFFGKEYTYTGQTKKGTEFTEVISFISNKIEKHLNLKKGYFNGCLLNLYRDGKDSIGYHSDNEKDMVTEAIIAVVSLGAERIFCIKNNITKQVFKFSLPDCSLTIMNPICQTEWKHSIPKEPWINEERISLTFRQFK